MKSEAQTIVSSPFLFKKGQVVTFLKPTVGIVKGTVLGTEYTSQMGYTVTILTKESGLEFINEKFLQKLVQRAA